MTYRYEIWKTYRQSTAPATLLATGRVRQPDRAHALARIKAKEVLTIAPSRDNATIIINLIGPTS